MKRYNIYSIIFINLIYSICLMYYEQYGFISSVCFFRYFTATTTIVSALSYVFTKDTYKILKKQK